MTGPAAPIDALAIAPADGPGAPPGAAEAARGVESIFLSLLVSELRKAGGGEGLFGGGTGAGVFEGFFDRIIGEQLAGSGGIGLAAAIEENLSRLRTAGGDTEHREGTEDGSWTS